MLLQRNIFASALLALSFTLPTIGTHAGQSTIDLEVGFVTTGYNDVRIPGDSGTPFSLSDDLDAEDTAAFRIRYGRQLSEKHWMGILAAPLTVESEGTLDEEVNFDGTTFPAGGEIDASFRFDSYRFIYRYLLKSSETFSFSLGGALKIRDAAIRLESAGLKAENDNLGLVPLLSFNLTWSPYRRIAFVIDGEALAAPQGRAEDVLFAAVYNVNDKLSLRTGYRVLEGGADNDEVYTFSLFHYFTLGAIYSF